MSELIAGKEGNMVVSHLSHAVQKQIGTFVAAFTNHKGQDQTPNWGKGYPNPSITLRFTIKFSPSQVLFFGMHETP